MGLSWSRMNRVPNNFMVTQCYSSFSHRFPHENDHLGHFGGKFCTIFRQLIREVGKEGRHHQGHDLPEGWNLPRGGIRYQYNYSIMWTSAYWNGMNWYRPHISGWIPNSCKEKSSKRALDFLNNWTFCMFQCSLCRPPDENCTMCILQTFSQEVCR